MQNRNRCRWVKGWTQAKTLAQVKDNRTATVVKVKIMCVQVPTATSRSLLSSHDKRQSLPTQHKTILRKHSAKKCQPRNFQSALARSDDRRMVDVSPGQLQDCNAERAAGASPAGSGHSLRRQRTSVKLLQIWRQAGNLHMLQGQGCARAPDCSAPASLPCRPAHTSCTAESQRNVKDNTWIIARVTFCCIQVCRWITMQHS